MFAHVVVQGVYIMTKLGNKHCFNIKTIYEILPIFNSINLKPLDSDV